MVQACRVGAARTRLQAALPGDKCSLGHGLSLVVLGPGKLRTCWSRLGEHRHNTVIVSALMHCRFMLYESGIDAAPSQATDLHCCLTDTGSPQVEGLQRQMCVP